MPAELPVRRLQEALIREPIAPAAPLPLWDTPWHHPDWRSRQLEALADPGRIDDRGRMAALPIDPFAAPAEPGERLWQGELVPEGDGEYRLYGCAGPDGHPWRLITLEPALHDWLSMQSRPLPVRLIGCANPWGPWLRVSRLA
jgi:hypothetical protein